jgi:toxin ParE1/3/4
VTFAFHPQALKELRSLAAWYEQRRDGLGADFRDEVWRALDIIAEEPSRWPLSTFPGTHGLGVRHFVVHRFPVTVEYTIDPEQILVLAVAHMRRAPGYWLSRLRPRTRRNR